MTTRAEEILRMIPEQFNPFLVMSPAVVGASIAHGVYQAKRRTAEKVAQAGMGQQHQQAKRELSTLRRKNVATLGLSGGLAGKVAAQKARVKNIETQGLAKFHQTLSANPQQQAQVRRQEQSS